MPAAFSHKISHRLPKLTICNLVMSSRVPCTADMVYVLLANT